MSDREKGDRKRGQNPFFTFYVRQGDREKGDRLLFCSKKLPVPFFSIACPLFLYNSLKYHENHSNIR